MAEATYKNGSVDVRGAVRALVRVGVAPTPLPYKAKKSNRDRYTQDYAGTGLTEDKALSLFEDTTSNVGGLLGVVSGGAGDGRYFVVPEGDCPEAIALMHMLPHTPFRFGRESAPESHRGYRTDGKFDLRKEYRDHDGHKVIEILQAGHVVLPPSVYPADEAKGHPEPERSMWADEPFPEPRFVPGERLTQAVREWMTATLILRALPPEGSRYEWSLALIGFLGRRLDAEAVERILLAQVDVAPFSSERKRDEARQDIPHSIWTTFQKLESGGPTTGGPRMDEYTPGLMKAIAAVWDWDTSAERVLELVEQVEETGDPDLVWEGLGVLAKANVATYQKAKKRLKKRIGKDLNLNDLERAVNAARKQQKDGKPTDDELRDRWAERHSNNLVFGLGGWMRYGWQAPGIWSPAPEYEVERQIEEVCVAAKPEGIRPTAALVASVERLARNRRAVSAELWDADPDILVCTNGALHIPTRELRPHDPAYYATSGVPYGYDSDAQAPMWERFLNEIIVPAVGEEGAAFLQEYAGYCLTTDTSHELALWLCGPPGGGRSTFIFAMEAMLGERAGTLGLHEISTSQFALASVPGKTLLTATEQPAGYVKASHVLNKLISGDRIRVEEKYKSAYDFYPKAKLLWAMNDLPKVASSYDGLFRRVKVIRLPEIEKKDPKVKETITTEGAGILNWALEGLARLKERGRFAVPEAVQSATQEWRESNDVAALFVAERCDRGEGYKVQGDALYSTYSGWCRENGFTPKNAKNAAEDWERLGFFKTRIKGRSYWHGLRIAPIVLTDDTDIREKAG